jgi:hypothetical protein
MYAAASCPIVDAAANAAASAAAHAAAAATQAASASAATSAAHSAATRKTKGVHPPLFSLSLKTLHAAVGPRPRRTAWTHCTGAPLLAVEAVSPTTLFPETGVLASSAAIGEWSAPATVGVKSESE